MKRRDCWGLAIRRWAEKEARSSKVRGWQTSAGTRL
jgi:hypothetical protein